MHEVTESVYSDLDETRWKITVYHMTHSLVSFIAYRLLSDEMKDNFNVPFEHKIKDFTGTTDVV